MKKNILVPFDGSKNAVEALREAMTLAKSLNEKIILFNVQPNIETIHTKIFFGKCDINEYQEKIAQEVLKPAVDIVKESGIDYTVKTRVGYPKTEICSEARESGVRWIIMGSRGMNAVVGGILGSVSYGVLHEAPCPVMIIPYSAEVEN